jgi:hypothetical protein
MIVHRDLLDFYSCYICCYFYYSLLFYPLLILLLLLPYTTPSLLLYTSNLLGDQHPLLETRSLFLLQIPFSFLIDDFFFSCRRSKPFLRRILASRMLTLFSKELCTLLQATPRTCHNLTRTYTPDLSQLNPTCTSDLSQLNPNSTPDLSTRCFDE